MIREATKTDTSELEDIFLVTRKASFKWEDSKSFKIGDYQKSIKGERVFVAEINKKVVGFVSIWEADSFIHNLFVDPNYQGKGVGKQLLKKAVTTFPLPLTLKVDIYNIKACNWYEKQGWKKVSTNEDDASPYHLYSYDGVDAPSTETIGLMRSGIK